MKITLPSSTHKIQFYFCSIRRKKITIYHCTGILLIAFHQPLFTCFKYQEAENSEET